MDYDVRLKSNGAYWQAWWHDERGRIETKGLGSKKKVTERQARAACRALAIEMSKAPLARTVPTLSEWTAKYIASRTDVGQATLEILRCASNYLHRHFDWDPKINTITRADAADFRSALARGELSLDNAFFTKAPGETTICKHIRAIKTMFREAEDQDLVAKNPFSKLRSVPPKPIKSWAEVSPADMSRILAACPNDGWRAFFALLRFGGLRTMEALNLRWCDVDFAGNRLNVHASSGRESTKARLRHPPIDPAKSPMGLGKILFAAFEAAPAGTVKVCHGVQESNVRHIAAGILERAGVQKYSKIFHTLRKNRVTELVTRYPLYVVTEWMGHDDAVAKAHYIRVGEELYDLPSESAAQPVPKLGEEDRKRSTNDPPQK